MWPVVFVLEVRPVRWALYLLLFGAAKGAAAGQVFGLLWFALAASLLWWRPMLAFGRGVADAVGQARALVLRHAPAGSRIKQVLKEGVDVLPGLHHARSTLEKDDSLCPPSRSPATAPKRWHLR